MGEGTVRSGEDLHARKDEASQIYDSSVDGVQQTAKLYSGTDTMVAVVGNVQTGLTILIAYILISVGSPSVRTP